jgi:ComF family protein
MGGIDIDKNMILDLLYPNRCPFCKEVRPYQDTLACSKCIEKLKKVEPPHCMRCGKTVDNPEEEYCGDCMAITKHFVRGFPVFSYEEPVKSALYDFKYKNQRDYAGFFADCICRYYGENLQKINPEGLVPVPVHPHKRRSRGYNQAELLALELGKRMGIPVYKDYLLRDIDTSPQKELGDKARMKNIKNAFKIGKNAIKLKKILLVDDIYTSGATVEACTGVLQAFGVEEVYYTSVAIGKGY